MSKTQRHDGYDGPTAEDIAREAFAVLPALHGFRARDSRPTEEVPTLTMAQLVSDDPEGVYVRSEREAA